MPEDGLVIVERRPYLRDSSHGVMGLTRDLSFFKDRAAVFVAAT